MKTVLEHPIYGKISYCESFWTGKKRLFIGEKELQKVSKKEFSDENGNIIQLKGNYLAGVKFVAGGEEIQLSPSVKWYEIALCVLPFLLILVWGNVPALFEIVPVVGGAIGGALSAVVAIIDLFIIKLIKQIWLKVLISVVMTGIAFLICFGVGSLILNLAS